jgi:hypothetical protein
VRCLVGDWIEDCEIDRLIDWSTKVSRIYLLAEKTMYSQTVQYTKKKHGGRLKKQQQLQ